MTGHLNFFRKNATVLLIFCLVLYAVHYLLTPKIKMVNSMKDHLAALDHERESYEKLYGKYLELDELIAEYNDLLNKLPEESDLSKFIKDIEDWSEQNGIILISMLPQEARIEQLEEIEARVIPCQVTIGGSLDLLLSFLSQLETYPRLCQISELKLARFSDKDTDYYNPWQLTVDVKLYYMPPY